jgi:hypothetical protein
MRLAIPRHRPAAECADDVMSQRLLQTTAALAVAEACLCFEHRDLHWGNLLLHAAPEGEQAFQLRGKPFAVQSCGIAVQLIDFTLSRLTTPAGQVACCRLDESAEWLFELADANDNPQVLPCSTGALCALQRGPQHRCWWCFAAPRSHGCCACADADVRAYAGRRRGVLAAGAWCAPAVGALLALHQRAVDRVPLRRGAPEEVPRRGVQRRRHDVQGAQLAHGLQVLLSTLSSAAAHLCSSIVPASICWGSGCVHAAGKTAWSRLIGA